MRQEAARWSLDVAGQCIHGTTQKPLDAFLAHEQGALLPLPPKPWELVRWTTAKVHAECHRQVEHACYSVPYRYVSHRLDVRLSTVEIYADFDLIPTWDLRNATYNSPFAKFSDDDDWATWYSDWLLNLSSLHELLGARPSPERANVSPRGTGQRVHLNASDRAMGGLLR